MACGVTLKRSMVDLDMLHSPERSLKRRRTSNTGHYSPYQPTQAASASVEKSPSVFDSVTSKISQDELKSYLRSEIRSLRRRRILPQQSGVDFQRLNEPASPSSSSASDSDGEQRMETGVAPFIAAAAAASSVSDQPTRSRDVPMFTLKQVQLICERLLNEQQARLRGEYEQLLNAKLAEQYDSFVRFTYDQIHRRFEDTPMSYLS